MNKYKVKITSEVILEANNAAKAKKWVQESVGVCLPVSSMRIGKDKDSYRVLFKSAVPTIKVSKYKEIEDLDVEGC